MAAGHSTDPARWREAFEELMGRIVGRFARVEPRLRAGRLVLGLLSDLPRKNCWTIAEWVGEANPHGMQHLLCRASWDADAVRDDVREYVVEHLYDEEAVLVVDETGDVKKGRHPVGAQRQSPPAFGRTVPPRHGRADRELPGRRLPCRNAGLVVSHVFLSTVKALDSGAWNTPQTPRVPAFERWTPTGVRIRRVA